MAAMAAMAAMVAVLEVVVVASRCQEGCQSLRSTLWPAVVILRPGRSLAPGILVPERPQLGRESGEDVSFGSRTTISRQLSLCFLVGAPCWCSSRAVHWNPYWLATGHETKSRQCV